MIQVQRKINSLIVGQFLGFKGNEIVVVAINGAVSEYTFEQFERLFKFTDESDAKQYEKNKQEVINDKALHQVNEEQLEELLKEAIEKNGIARQLEEQKRLEGLEQESNKQSKQNKPKNTKQNKQPKENLKQRY